MRQESDSYDDFVNSILDEIREKEEVERQLTDERYHKFVKSFGRAGADEYQRLCVASEEAKNEAEKDEADKKRVEFLEAALRKKGKPGF
jgi:TPP-dependent 2-oxoacid decarboxylase